MLKSFLSKNTIPVSLGPSNALAVFQQRSPEAYGHLHKGPGLWRESSILYRLEALGSSLFLSNMRTRSF